MKWPEKEEAKRLRDSGLTWKAIGDRFGVSAAGAQAVVMQVQARMAWLEQHDATWFHELHAMDCEGLLTSGAFTRITSAVMYARRWTPPGSTTVKIPTTAQVVEATDLRKAKNMGKQGMQFLAEALRRIGAIDNAQAWLAPRSTRLRCQSCGQILRGKAGTHGESHQRY